MERQEGTSRTGREKEEGRGEKGHRDQLGLHKGELHADHPTCPGLGLALFNSKVGVVFTVLASWVSAGAAFFLNLCFQFMKLKTH